MTLETIAPYLSTFGYLIIFISLFLGIVGIPAPEESLLVLIGMLCIHSDLSLGFSIFSAFSGTLVGMIVAYFFGRQINPSIFQKYGVFVGLTEERWMKVQENYRKRVKRTIILGLYLPGIRQINPYFAGFARVKFHTYLICSVIGSLIWTIPYMIGSYYVGNLVEIPLQYVSLIGFLFLFLFACSLIVKFVKKKLRKQPRGDIS